MIVGVNTNLEGILISGKKKYGYEPFGTCIDIPSLCETSLTGNERMQAETIYYKGKIWGNKQDSLDKPIDDTALVIDVHTSGDINRYEVRMRGARYVNWGEKRFKEELDQEELALLLRYLTEQYPRAAHLWKPDMGHEISKENGLYRHGKKEYETILMERTRNMMEAEKAEWADKRVKCVKIREEYSGWHDEDDHTYTFEMEDGSGMSNRWRQCGSDYKRLVLRVYCTREFGAEIFFE